MQMPSAAKDLLRFNGLSLNSFDVWKYKWLVI